MASRRGGGAAVVPDGEEVDVPGVGQTTEVADVDADLELVVPAGLG